MTKDPITIPEPLARRIRSEAERLGMTSEEYLIDLVVQGLDPPERAREYAESAKFLVDQAGEELNKGDLRQAAEKLWGATALAVEAYAAWREGKRLSSHRDLWEYKERLVAELGEWSRDAWYAGHAMHTCFYEGWCTRRDVETALRLIRKLVLEVKARVQG